LAAKLCTGACAILHGRYTDSEQGGKGFEKNRDVA